MRLLHGAVRGEGQLDVLLRRETADIEDHEIATGRAPLRAKRRRAARPMEAAPIAPTSEHAETLEPGGRELIAQARCGDQGAGGRIVKPAKVRRDRPLQPARPVVPYVAVEVRVEPAEHRNAQRPPCSPPRPPN